MSGDTQRFYHGTKTDLKPGDLIEPGYTLTTVRGVWESRFFALNPTKVASR